MDIEGDQVEIESLKPATRYVTANSVINNSQPAIAARMAVS